MSEIMIWQTTNSRTEKHNQNRIRCICGRPAVVISRKILDSTQASPQYFINSKKKKKHLEMFFLNGPNCEVIRDVFVPSSRRSASDQLTHAKKQKKK